LYSARRSLGLIQLSDWRIENNVARGTGKMIDYIW
jgi:hypothetical protein